MAKPHPSPVPLASEGGSGSAGGAPAAASGAASGAAGGSSASAAATGISALTVPTPRTRLSYTGIDALAKLVFVLVKAVDGGMPAKVTIFNKLVAIFARALLRDADANGAGSTAEAAALGGPSPDAAARFDQRPYLRLFTNLLRDMHQAPPSPPPGAPDDAATQESLRAAAAETAAFNAQILACFANVLHAVKPERVPGFAFAWLELLCHRLFLPALLSVGGQRGWPLVHRLVVDLFRFQYPALRRAEMNEGVKLLYKASLRLLLVLHHDFPEFLADYHSSLLDVLPPSCIQLRNLLLSAHPRALRLADPFAHCSHIDLLPECSVLPRMLGNPGDALPVPLREELEAFVAGRPTAAASASGSGASVLASSALGGAVKAALFAGPEEQAFTLSRYSLASVNALVLHLATATLARLQEEAAAANPAHVRGTVPPAATLAAAASSPFADVLRFLLTEVDAEGRYALLNALANQLRYPSAHTLLFSRALINLFVNAPGAPGVGEVIREQLTRVMLERVVVHRPHPWGLLVTFVDLIKNKAYGFWSHGFTRINADIEKLFDSVARSCMVPAAASGAAAAAAAAAAGGAAHGGTAGHAVAVGAE